MDEIRNKVAESGLITLDLADFLPKGSMAVIDIKDYLWQGIALKEKDFRQALKDMDWDAFRDKHVAVYCSEDAIIQSWAYMLIGAHLEGIAKSVYFGPKEKLEQDLLIQNISQINPEEYKGERVIVKGCGDKKISNSAYLKIAFILKPVVKNLMFGEACSSVPVWKNKL